MTAATGVELSPLVVGVGVGVDLASLRFVLLGCDSFALGALCLVLGG
jgi:hypothetical protein